MRITRPPRFVPARGIGGPHAQTLLGHLWPVRRDPFAPTRLDVQTLPIDLQDGDMVVAQMRTTSAGPVVYLLPGLQGSVRASYLALCANELLARGCAVVAL